MIQTDIVVCSLSCGHGFIHSHIEYQHLRDPFSVMMLRCTRSDSHFEPIPINPKPYGLTQRYGGQMPIGKYREEALAFMTRRFDWEIYSKCTKKAAMITNPTTTQ